MSGFPRSGRRLLSCPIRLLFPPARMTADASVRCHAPFDHGELIGAQIEHTVGGHDHTACQGHDYGRRGLDGSGAGVLHHEEQSGSIACARLFDSATTRAPGSSRVRSACDRRVHPPPPASDPKDPVRSTLEHPGGILAGVLARLLADLEIPFERGADAAARPSPRTGRFSLGNGSELDADDRMRPAERPDDRAGEFRFPRISARGTDEEPTGQPRARGQVADLGRGRVGLVWRPGQEFLPMKRVACTGQEHRILHGGMAGSAAHQWQRTRVRRPPQSQPARTYGTRRM